MTECANLCTAEKCQELENRINKLEQIVEQLKEINIFGFLANEKLNIEVKNAFNTSTESVDLSEFCTDERLDKHIDTEINFPSILAHEYNPPEPEPYTPTVTVEVNSTGNQDNIKTFEITVEVDSVVGSDTFGIEIPEIPEPEPYTPNLQFDIFPIGQDQYVFKVLLDGTTAQDTLTITHPKLPEPEPIPEPEPSNLKIGGSYYDEILTLTISDGESSDSTSISIPIDDITSSIIFNTQMECDLTPVLAILDEHSIVLEDIKKKTENNYQILGGDVWGLSNNDNDSENNDPETENSDSSPNSSLKIEAEKTLRIMGGQQYNSDGELGATNSDSPSPDKEVEVKNIIELLQAYFSVNYHRAGYQRLPAELVPSLIKPEEGEELITINDNLSFQEWIVKQIDGLIGQFPVIFEYKTSDEEGNVTSEEINIPNIAEFFTQILALNLIETENSENVLNAVLRNLTETRCAVNTALVVHDYVKANTEYLGYRGKETKKEIDLTFTPGGKNLKETLKPSTQKVIGWEFQDRNTLDELIKKISFSSDIIKASLFVPFTPEGNVTGDAIQENLNTKKEIQDEQWANFKQNINTPTGIHNIPNKPTGYIKDIEQEDK